MNRLRQAKCAFTLIELLVVIGIMVLLAAILLPTVLRAIGQAEKVQANSDIKQIETAVKAFFNEYGRYPGQVKSEDFISSTDSRKTPAASSSWKSLPRAWTGTNLSIHGETPT